MALAHGLRQLSGQRAVGKDGTTAHEVPNRNLM